MHRTEGTYNLGNLFQDGPPGTHLEENWLNAVQEEICNVIETAGFPLKTRATETRTQLYEALQTLFASNSLLLSYNAGTNYIANLSYVVGSDGNMYHCGINNGPSSTVVDPVGDATGTWVILVYSVNILSGTIAQLAESSNDGDAGINADVYENVFSAVNGARIFDDANLTVANAALIIDDTGLSLSKAISIGQHANLTHARRDGIFDLKTRLLHAWFAGGNLATARYHLAGCGTHAAGLSFGGHTGAVSAVTEEYDGLVWSAGGALSTARKNLAGCGTQTAGLSFGGFIAANSAVTEEYDGAAWAGGGALSTARENLGGCGTQTAGLSFGGYVAADSAVTEEYDGAAWVAGGALNTARNYIAGCGTQTAGLSFGGNAYLATTEEYNGATWAAGGALNTARNSLGGCGTQTAGLSFGGYDGSYKATTEEYNGTSWTAGGDLATARRDLAGCGAQSSGLSFGGDTGAFSVATEEYW
jgi:hypothetical protein